MLKWWLVIFTAVFLAVGANDTLNYVAGLLTK